MAFFSRLLRIHRNNVTTLRQTPLAEISGAVGDLGSFLPLMIALALRNSISLSSTLIFSGLFNILTGAIFGIPLPVQPMKAIAASALATRASIYDTTGAGALVGAAVLALAATGLLARLTAHIPVPVVKGIQLGTGLSLCISAGTTLLAPLAHGVRADDNLLWAFLAFLALLLTQRLAAHRFPFALAVFVLGIAVALLVLLLHRVPLPRLQPWRPYVFVPTLDAWRVYAMALAQLPLTTLNSVVAVAALAAELFPAGAGGGGATPGVTALGVSVGLMNLSGCWFGAMPVCHGSGGLAAQYRFGARSGASVALLGLLKLGLGLSFGDSLLRLLRGFPKSLLGVLVVAAGLELAMVGENLNSGAADLWEASAREAEGEDGVLGPLLRRRRGLTDEEKRERWMVMLVTAAGILAFKNAAVGFVAGLMWHWAYRSSDWVEKRWTRQGQREGHSLLD